MNDPETSANATHVNVSNTAPPHALHLNSTHSVDDQQHMGFGNDGQHDYTYFPNWLSNSDDNGQHALSYDIIRQGDPSLDHNQQGIFTSAFADVDTGSSAMDTNYALSLVDSASTAGLASHTGSPLDYGEEFGQMTPSSYLTAGDSHTHDARARPPIGTSASYNSSSTTMSAGTAAPPRCTCYCDILQRLSELKDNKSGDPYPSVDYIMQLDMDIRTQISAMVGCDICLFQRTRALLLVGVVLESLVDLLESLALADPLLAAGECSARPTLDTRMGSDSSSGSDASYHTTALQMGATHVSVYETRGSLRPLIQTRLQEVFGLTRQLHGHLQAVRAPQTNFGAADTVMTELSLRICALMGQLEFDVNKRDLI